jgi:hypothetical protein
MHGKISSNQVGKLEKKEESGKSDDGIDKDIDAYVDAMELEDQSHLTLQNQQMKRAAIKEEIKEAIKLSELNQHTIGRHYFEFRRNKVSFKRGESSASSRFSRGSYQSRQCQG